MARKMDAIAVPIKVDYEWEFEGSVGDFAEKWGDKFLALPQSTDPENEKPFSWFIGVTQFTGFGQR